MDQGFLTHFTAYYLHGTFSRLNRECDAHDKLRIKVFWCMFDIKIVTNIISNASDETTVGMVCGRGYMMENSVTNTKKPLLTSYSKLNFRRMTNIATTALAAHEL
jgi:hypothetical protein